MEKIKPKHRSIIGSLCAVILSITFILFSIYFSPIYVANNLSADGIIEPVTIFKINMLRIGLSALGISFLFLNLLFLFKPYLLKLIINRLDIRNTYLSASIWFFSIITLIIGLPNVINSIVDFRFKIEKIDEHNLRIKFHPWYREEHEIMEFIQNNIPNNEPLLVNGKHKHFLAYYLAPRPIYRYSKNFVESLATAKSKYYVLNLIWHKNGNKIIQWSISEEPGGNVIIQKIEESSY